VYEFPDVVISKTGRNKATSRSVSVLGCVGVTHGCKQQEQNGFQMSPKHNRISIVAEQFFMDSSK